MACAKINLSITNSGVARGVHVGSYAPSPRAHQLVHPLNYIFVYQVQAVTLLYMFSCAIYIYIYIYTYVHNHT